jgi:acyl carrier protein
VSDAEFLAAFADTIGVAPGEVAMTTRLKNLDLWDSVAYLSVMVLLDDKMGVALNPEALLGAETPGDILKSARSEQ